MRPLDMTKRPHGLRRKKVRLLSGAPRVQNSPLPGHLPHRICGAFEHGLRLGIAISQNAVASVAVLQ